MTLAPRVLSLTATFALALLACDAPPVTPASTPLPPPPTASTAPAPPTATDAAARLMAALATRDASAIVPFPADAGPQRPPCLDTHATDAGIAPDGARARRPPSTPWSPPAPNEWQPLLRNYAPRVTIANRRQLLSAKVPFAVWLSAVHRAVHPFFADGYLSFLDTLPCDDPQNDPTLTTTLELVVAGDTGHLLHVAIAHSSGLDAFDEAATTAFARAAPFPIAPAPIRSTDGNVYVRWDILRDEVYACSVLKVLPVLLDLSTTP